MNFNRMSRSATAENLRPQTPRIYKNWNNIVSYTESETTDATTDLSSSSPTISSPTSSSTSASTTPEQRQPTIAEMNKWRYPRQNSFIVDMNHKPNYDVGGDDEPLYENVSKEKPKTSDPPKPGTSKIFVPPKPAEDKIDSVSAANQGWSKSKTEIFFPTNSPLHPQQKNKDSKGPADGNLPCFMKSLTNLKGIYSQQSVGGTASSPKTGNVGWRINWFWAGLVFFFVFAIVVVALLSAIIVKLDNFQEIVEMKLYKYNKTSVANNIP